MLLEAGIPRVYPGLVEGASVDRRHHAQRYSAKRAVLDGFYRFSYFRIKFDIDIIERKAVSRSIAINNGQLFRSMRGLLVYENNVNE